MLANKGKHLGINITSKKPQRTSDSIWIFLRGNMSEYCCRAPYSDLTQLKQYSKIMLIEKYQY